MTGIEAAITHNVIKISHNNLPCVLCFVSFVLQV